ncbi:uncharacterized protein LOC131314715 [Rhododendron vialii]|uniref:uncharacterized protein LOC131314715 n=1 Tax=Rhododendron vialii TaxID=182163 RepID=UPI00265E1A00|nr:uncharacterized protein LOC131314715 [Rhododendron vialii]
MLTLFLQMLMSPVKLPISRSPCITIPPVSVRHCFLSHLFSSPISRLANRWRRLPVSCQCRQVRETIRWCCNMMRSMAHSVTARDRKTPREVVFYTPWATLGRRSRERRK